MTLDDFKKLAVKAGMAKFMQAGQVVPREDMYIIGANFLDKLHELLYKDKQDTTKPFGHFHELLNHEGKGNGIWLGCNDLDVVKKSHIDGETGDKIVTLYEINPQ